MTDHQAYIMGRNGHIQGYEPFSCLDDAAAISAAGRLIGFHGVEVCRDARKGIALERTRGEA